MNILLLGILGSGKTSIGTLLAQELGYTFVELDDIILKKNNFESVAEVYNKRMSLWKEKELEVMQELSQGDNQVIACGGAIVENMLNILYFKESSAPLTVIYLQTKPETLSDRLIKDYDQFKKEGPKHVLGKMTQHFEHRNGLFLHAADHVVNTDDEMPEDVCEKITKLLK